MEWQLSGGQPTRARFATPNQSKKKKKKKQNNKTHTKKKKKKKKKTRRKVNPPRTGGEACYSRFVEHIGSMSNDHPPAGAHGCATTTNNLACFTSPCFVACSYLHADLAHSYGHWTPMLQTKLESASCCYHGVSDVERRPEAHPHRPSWLAPHWAA